MSHHLDTEAARQDPRVNISDSYVFKGTSGTVMVANTNPLSADGGFHPEALYEFKVDTDGDAVEDVTLRASFGPREADGAQALTLTLLTGAGARDRDAVGQVVARGRTGEDITGTDGVRVWAGRAGEPFYMNGAVITAVKEATTTGAKLALDDTAEAVNLFGGTDVTALVVEVPAAITGTGVIGFWATSALPDHHGGWVQINRTATPLINTLFDLTEGGTHDFNAADPCEDLARFGRQVAEDVARVVAANGTEPPEGAEAYGAGVRDLLLPDMLTYLVGTDAYFGVRDRNGRGLTESAPEAMFELVLNRPVPLGIGPEAASGTLRDTFPYLSEPVAAA